MNFSVYSAKSSFFKASFRNLAVAAVLATLSGVAIAQTVVEEMVAKVNSDIVTRSDLKRERETMQNELKQQDAANADA